MQFLFILVLFSDKYYCIFKFKLSYLGSTLQQHWQNWEFQIRTFQASLVTDVSVLSHLRSRTNEIKVIIRKNMWLMIKKSNLNDDRLVGRPLWPLTLDQCDLIMWHFHSSVTKNKVTWSFTGRFRSVTLSQLLFDIDRPWDPRDMMESFCN